MISRPAKPSDLIEQISELLLAKGCSQTSITFNAVGVAAPGERQSYGFWITTNPNLKMPEMGELIRLFNSNGFKPLSITYRRSDFVIFTS